MTKEQRSPFSEAQLRHVDALSPFINDIRTRLFSQVSGVGRAAVMVGAGFSRNTIALRPDSSKLPLWSGITAALIDELYPAGHATGTSRVYAAKLNPLRLAQEYFDTFGAEKLDELLRQKLPDAEHLPGPLHRLLLGLPWCEVFTTNYDTLLERCAEEMSVTKYSVVRAPDDIPNTSIPRIVKLHGSFPSTRPFILTEEHYRRYPNQLAPFVVLVQQSIMANAFCLLGFSGDDPNFLSWTGWVRDTLGQYCPPIYLCGCLDLTDPARNVLTRRGVVPIDLSPLFPRVEYFDEDRRQRDALEWLLLSFGDGRPYDSDRWPHSYTTASDQREHRPRPKIAVRAPLNESPFPEDIPTAIAKLRHNREVYPGWAIAPKATRERASDVFRGAASLLRKPPESFKAEVMLEFLYEIVCRARVCMRTLETVFIERIEVVIKEVNPFGDKLGIHGSALSFSAENANNFHWQAIRHHWMYLTLTLMAYCRREGKRDEWLQYRVLAESVIDFFSESDLYPHFLFELCIDAQERGDDATTREALSRWSYKSVDPMWRMKMAAILAAIGETPKSKTVVDEARTQIRRALTKAPRSVYLLSRAVWADMLARWLRLGDDEGTGAIGEDEDEDDIKVQGFSCGELIAEIRHVLKRARLESGWTELRGFYPRSRRPRLHITSAHEGDEAILFLEEVPIPTHVCWKELFATVEADFFKTLIAWLPKESTTSILALLWRSLHKDALREWLSRFMVAALPAGEAQEVQKRSSEILYDSAGALTWDSRYRLRLSIALVFLERLGLRSQAQERLALFSQALSLFRQFADRHAPDSDFAQFDSLSEAFRAMLSSLWWSLDAARVGDYIGDIVSLPLRRDCDLASLLEREDLRTSKTARAPRVETISWLLESLQADQKRLAQSAAERLLYLCRLRMLDRKDIQRFTRWAWPAQGASRMDPELIHFLPGRYRRPLEARLHPAFFGDSGKEWIKRSPLSFVRFVSLSWDESELRCVVDWSEKDAHAFLDVFCSWWDASADGVINSLSTGAGPRTQPSALMAQLFRALAIIFFPLSLDSARLRRRMREVLTGLSQIPYCGHTFAFLALLLGSGARGRKAVEELSLGLESRDHITLYATFHALRFMETMQSQGLIAEQDVSRIEELFVAHLRLRTQQIGLVLRGLSQWLRARSDRPKDRFLTELDRSLGRLFSDLAYAPESGRVIADEELPDCRLGVQGVIRVLEERYGWTSETTRAWGRSFDVDPLPEIRERQDWWNE